MWIAIEILTRLREQEKFQDIEAIQWSARDDAKLCKDVPEENKRQAIKYAVKCWDETGDRDMFRQLADRAYSELIQCRV